MRDQSRHGSIHTSASNAMGMVSQSLDTAQIANHSGFRWRHIVIVLFPSPCLWVIESPPANILVRAIAATIARTIFNSLLNANDATYKVQIVMLLA